MQTRLLLIWKSTTHIFHRGLLCYLSAVFLAGPAEEAASSTSPPSYAAGLLPPRDLLLLPAERLPHRFPKPLWCFRSLGVRGPRGVVPQLSSRVRRGHGRGRRVIGRHDFVVRRRRREEESLPSRRVQRVGVRWLGGLVGRSYHQDLRQGTRDRQHSEGCSLIGGKYDVFR